MTKYVNMAGHIECWEADDNGDSWYSKLSSVMKDVSQLSLEAAADAAMGSPWGS